MNQFRASVAAACLALAACSTTQYKTEAPKTQAPTTVPANAQPTPVASAPSAQPRAEPAVAAPVQAAVPAEQHAAAAPVVAKPAPAPKPVAVAPIAKTLSLSSANPASGDGRTKSVTTTVKPALVATAAPPPAPAAGSVSLSGQVQLLVGPGQSVDADEVADAVVYFVPNAGAPHPKPGHFQIFTSDKMFDPSSLVVPIGSVVSFPNKDEILHNVFSATPGSEFDLGLYGEGKSADATFNKAGLVIVNCNVHHVMQASIFVLDTPYFAQVSKNGSFRLAGIPAAAGKLMLWHPRGTIQTLDLPSPAGDAISMQLTLSKPRVTAHLNKELKQYQPSRN